MLEKKGGLAKCSGKKGGLGKSALARKVDLRVWQERRRRQVLAQ